MTAAHPKARLRPHARLRWLAGAALLAAGAAQAAEPDAAAQAEFLRKAVAGTPYSALVVHTRVDIAPLAGKDRASSQGQPAEAGEERHTYHARVLETFRGAKAPSIRYEMVVESGESAELSSQPQIVTLCKGPRGLYWPGVGASFPGGADAVAQARAAAKQAAAASQCD